VFASVAWCVPTGLRAGVDADVHAASIHR